MASNEQGLEEAVPPTTTAIAAMPADTEDDNTKMSEASKPEDHKNPSAETSVPAEEESAATETAAAANGNFTVAAPSQQNQTTLEDSSTKSDISMSNSKGAQILMNRFSSWKESTKQNAQEIWKEQGPTIHENAKRVWKQAPSIRRFPPIPPTGNINNTAEDEEAKNFVNMTSASPEKREATARQESEGTTSSVGDEEDEVSSNGNYKSEEEVLSEGTEDILSLDVNVGAALTKASVAASKASKAASKASAAATVVAESVATNFRGRYTSNTSKSADTQNENAGTEHPSKTLPESQTELILKSRVGEHMQEILDKLEPHQFAMLLGRGMLGVNLKQCYLKNHGVFIDFLVTGGQAEASRIVRSGDLLVTLGETDLRKQTIVQIPQEISKVRRPSVLIFGQGTPVALERMNYLDIVVAMIHRARYLSLKKGGIANLTATTSEIEESKDSDAAICENPVPVDDTSHNYATPPAPTLELRKEFVDEVTLR
jgi:hypothetical protein